MLNDGETGAGITQQPAGIEVDRGTESNVTFVYNDTDDQMDIRHRNIGSRTFTSAHETYDLGSTTARWRDLYLSGSSIKLGVADITSDADGVITLGSAGIVTTEEVKTTPTTTNVTVDLKIL